MELEERYKGMDLDISKIDQYLDDLNEVSKLIKEENRIKSKIEDLKHNRRVNKGSRTKPSPNLFVGVAITSLGIILIPILFILGLIVGLAGAILLVKSFSDRAQVKEENINTDNDLEFKELDRELKEIEKTRKDLENGYLSFIESINERPSNIASFLADSKVDIIEYKRLKNIIEENLSEIEKLELYIDNLKREIKKYLNKYFDHVEESDYSKVLSDLRNDLSSYENLLKLEDSYNETIQEANNFKKLVEEKLRYYYDQISDIRSIVQDLTSRYSNLERAEYLFKEAKEKKEKFELQNNISILNEIDLEEKQEKEYIEKLAQDKKELNENSNALIKKIEGYKKDMDNLIQEVDKIEDIESEIIKIEEEIKDLTKQHSLLNLTKECMIEAKKKLAEKYIGDVSYSFKKYLNKLNDGEAKKYHIDINLNISVEHGGKLYDRNQLSSGMKDLVQLCLRMALVESVYKDSYNPILVLDDPFINLDNNRLEKSIELLKETSSKYQIIYFVCHSSRNVKLNTVKSASGI